uniref:Uncharacterized protein n=1 Tax=Candidatus Kentrum sp. DK TaxID=2126562 RepID=A0A450T2W2_9GAMM|nr:MAG: hypothetical protein BECKDK2373C_GA0170839_10853 [Candidatus Kentron sp. DK]
MIDHRLGVMVAEVAENGQHQGVRGVFFQEIAAIHLPHVQDAVAVTKVRLVDPTGHGKRFPADVDKVLPQG